MVGPDVGSGPGWYFMGKHYGSPQELHGAMNAEMDSLRLQIDALKLENTVLLKDKQYGPTDRLLSWVEAVEGRKPPSQAFTAGPERRIADLWLMLEKEADDANRQNDALRTALQTVLRELQNHGNIGDDELCKIVNGALSGSIVKRKCASTTGTDGCVSCVKEPGHEMPHSDGNLISWRP